MYIILLYVSYYIMYFRNINLYTKILSASRVFYLMARARAHTHTHYLALALSTQTVQCLSGARMSTCTQVAGGSGRR